MGQLPHYPPWCPGPKDLFVWGKWSFWSTTFGIYWRTTCWGQQKILGQKSCRTEVSRIFRIFSTNFAAEFCSEFSPDFLRSFRASFRGKRRPEKIHQKSPPFSNAKFPGKFRRKNFTEVFWRAGKVEKYNFHREFLLHFMHGFWDMLRQNAKLPHYPRESYPTIHVFPLLCCTRRG